MKAGGQQQQGHGHRSSEHSCEQVGAVVAAHCVRTDGPEHRISRGGLGGAVGEQLPRCPSWTLAKATQMPKGPFRGQASPKDPHGLHGPRVHVPWAPQATKPAAPLSRCLSPWTGEWGVSLGGSGV